MEFHEIANIFPMMLGDEYRKLKDDIESIGQLESVVIYEGKILDGRNRYTVCKDLGIDVKYENFTGNDALQFVISKNLRRRHLDTSQRALIAARLANMQVGDTAYNLRNVDSANLQSRSNLVSQTEAAEMFNVSPRIVASVKAIENNNPEFIPYIESGVMTVHEAEKGIKKQERAEMHASKRAQAFPVGKYAVIYADPPWKYDNSGFDEAADAEYPTMPLDEICSLPVQSLASDGSILFLWATNPLLQEAMKVISAWGFEYKTNMAWIKDRGRGKGWYLKSKHELLLIGTREGTPHPETRPDSCFESPRGNVHSKKPELAYEIIESMYPGNKIELFSRQPREGWEAWGNE